VSAVFTRKRHTLRYGLVDNIYAYLGKAIYIGLTGPEVAAFDGIVEKTVYTVAVIAVVLRCIDTSLRGYAVRTAGTIMKAEAMHAITQFGKGCGGGGSGQAGTYDYYIQLSLVGRVYQLNAETVIAPFVL
jgi:hypothetical protein